MSLAIEEKSRLEKKAHELRLLSLDTVGWAGSGHIGGAMSAMDIMTILYHKYMKIDPSDPAKTGRDRFILSKGHVGVGYAPVLANLGYFDPELLKEYNHTGSPLGMHLDSLKVPGVEASTGSLGHGLSLGLGMALGARVKGESWRVFVLLGDGECDEGSVWEAAMAAAHFKAVNLVTIVDRNRCMIDGPTEEVMALEPFADKWRAFGFEVVEADGHDFDSLSAAVERALAAKDKPVVIIADTVKGAGIDFIENDYKWHYGSFDAEKAAKAKESLARYHERRIGTAKGEAR
ncbi:MAG TPA: transketolase [Treponema sp.]|nr:MAG: transketolase [Treponema sp. GWC1_61_84]OHE66249.1 MAG: transketolase [Treponema sp. GWA1_62_8]OHE76570.1 MAG: transketolase [Treponema sp. RIFOXYC1_FULL_61_9]HCM28530.1 transketolase [Treponema sp.]